MYTGTFYDTVLQYLHHLRHVVEYEDLRDLSEPLPKTFGMTLCPCDPFFYLHELERSEMCFTVLYI